MPLARYLIRNEFGLAEPELYKAAERDDSGALLQGVAVAGLVGVLRQLGDLAEFAAEIFHDLHEEVIATAARGHGLMARVQQLEADFPSVEKALLSQTSHSPFFSAPGIDWHPNLHPGQNLVTRGALPRFVMDSYEECRGPPRLFLLDKFDVAGAGACLKRYTDPSFFKVETSSPELATDVQREKKTRKVKKKGARMRNRETPEVAPTSHAKLHQLLQEERFENGFRDPARVVKLKKRQLNGYPFDLETGKSYMEKFVETPSPEHKLVNEVPFYPPYFEFRPDNTSETAIEVLEINTVSAVKKSLQGNERTCSPPYAPQELIEPSIDELKEEITDRAGRSTFSYSDTLSNLAWKTPSDGDGAGKESPSNEACIAEVMETPSDQFSPTAEIPECNPDKLQVPSDMCTRLGTISCNADETGASMTDSTVVCSRFPLQNGDQALFSVPGETRVVDELHNGDLDVISDAPLHLPNVSEIWHEKKQSSDCCGHEMLKVTDADKTGSVHSVSTTEEPVSVQQEVEVSSETNLGILTPMVDVLQPLSSPDQQFYSLPYFEEKIDFDNISKAVGGHETGGYICNVDGAVREAIPLELPCNYLNYEDDEDEDEVNNDAMMEMVEAEDVAIGLTDSSDHSAMDQSDSGIPLIEIFPEATKGHQEMPPLPPMQWRIGKARSAPLDSMTESVQCSPDSHTSVLSCAADEKVHLGFSAPNRGTLQPHNPFLPHAEVEDEVGDTQSLNPFITLPTISSDRAKHAIQALGGELIESSSNPFLPESAVEDANCNHDPVSPKGSLMKPLNQLAPVIAEDVKILQHIPKDVERQGDHSPNIFPPSQNVENEQPRTDLSTSEGERAWHSKTSVLVSLFEVPKPNGHSTTRPSRPRSPLTDAVAALDKSKLRKVTDRVRPGIEPKVDEKDTLLEQIRAKSFNLKPAVVTRPSIEGPKTNLKVVAIVEKANAIRQALAGSDDDEDSDSWSDS